MPGVHVWLLRELLPEPQAAVGWLRCDVCVCTGISRGKSALHLCSTSVRMCTLADGISALGVDPDVPEKKGLCVRIKTLPLQHLQAATGASCELSRTQLRRR